MIKNTFSSVFKFTRKWCSSLQNKKHVFEAFSRLQNEKHVFEAFSSLLNEKTCFLSVLQVEKMKNMFLKCFSNLQNEKTRS